MAHAGSTTTSGRAVSRARWQAVAFALGSACFFLGPFPGYVDLVGTSADAITFFVGSLFFTAGGALQTWGAAGGRRLDAAGRMAWWVAIVQSAGTLFFNFSTFRALHAVLSSSNYNQLVWRPDAFGSVCFLASGLIAYLGSARHGWRPVRDGRGWWQPGVNLLGCVFFGISAVAGYVIPSSASMLDQAAANWNTAAGAACFLACAVAGLHRPA